MTLSNNVSSAGNQQETLLVKSNLINHKWGILRDYTPNAIYYSDELVILIALLFTDGGVSKHGPTSWRIFFANTSLEAITIFKELMRNLFKLSPGRIKVYTTLERYHFATVTSKEIGRFLNESFGTFRTLKFKDGKFPLTKIPVKELIDSGKVGLFLRTAFSMDGGVKFYIARARDGRRWLERSITLACHHPILRQQYLKLLNSINIQAINIERGNVIKFSKRENFEQFAQKVGFLSGIKTTRHSKFWVGVEKNDVLRMMIDSYNNPSHYLSLPQFK